MQETRYRSTGTVDDEAHRDGMFERQKRAPRDFEKKKGEFYSGGKDKHANWKHHLVRLVLLSLFLAALATIIFPFTSFHSNDASRQRWGRRKASRVWESSHFQDRHRAQVLSMLGPLKSKRGGQLKIGLVNFEDDGDHEKWQALSGRGFPLYFPFEHLNEDIEWPDLFPEWIDEEEQYEVPKCPSVPMPAVKQGTRLDLVVANVPCNISQAGWSRDVVRLQVELAAAHVAALTESTYVLLFSSCRPIPNLYTCGELLAQQDGAWLFQVDLAKLRKKLALPVGSCELAIPLKSKSRPFNNANARREAYATILHSAQFYVCGAIAVAQSIRMTGSTRDLIILVDENISPEHRQGLEAAGWLVKGIQRIRNPNAEPEAYNEWNYSKFRLWLLTDYDKIIFMDADLLVLQNIDFLFELPEISAIGNNATLFNSGVMVIEPSKCTFQLLMDHINEIVSYNGGDQGYLNEIFTWWHRLPKYMNYLKHIWSNDTEELEVKTHLFAADPPEIYVLHYLGLKPWLCFRDYDCNWNVADQWSYASDVAHATWWKIHDKMPENLQKFCLLKSKQKAALEWDRREAEKAAYPDEHWKRNITDSRLHICNEKFCFWESMLWHWGDPNYKDGAPSPSVAVSQ